MNEARARSDVLRALCAETLGTFVLVFAGTGAIVVDSITHGAVTHVGVALVFGLEALFAGPISGASMNPARSLAPAIVSGSLRDAWIYVAAPVAGALLAVPACRLLRSPGCCRSAEECG